MSRVVQKDIWALNWQRVLRHCTRTGTQSRCIQIRATVAAEPVTGPKTASPHSSVESLDARFDVIGSPYSLLSVSLSASQSLFTRRGTLVGLSGKADNVISTLRILEPIRRAIVGTPFLYQKISSTSPVTALISVRSPVTSFAVVHLNGSLDWMVAQRRTLLAWTGRSLTIKPRFNTHLSLSHWGSSEVAGRGLLALVGNGLLYSVEVKAGEQYVAHPSNVVAYTVTSSPPRPYRFKSTSLNFQVPDRLQRLPQFFQKSKFLHDMSNSETWKTSMRIWHKLLTWSRMAIWGDRLFLQFDGPATILIQSRGSRLNDVLSSREVNEIAGTPSGLTVAPEKAASAGKAPPQSEANSRKEAVEVNAAPAPSRSVAELDQEIRGIGHSVASVGRDGKVVFEKPVATK